MRAKILPILATIAMAAMSAACAWDYDTMSAEAKGLPDLVDALVGRIQIYPPEYYQFRIDRSSKIVANDPANLDELDNLIVAYDKLGNSKEAFRYAAIKRKALDAHPNKEHEYRYYANLGTIEAHSWFRSADHQDKSLLDKSIAHLKKCISINPDAHFGREIVQVKMIELAHKGLMSKLASPQANLEMQNYLDMPGDNEDEWEKFVEKTGADKVAKGVIGMMTLGGGPDSPDLIAALQATIPNDKGLLHQIAYQRIRKLSEKKIAFAGLRTSATYFPVDSGVFFRQYKALLDNASLYRTTLDGFIKGKLKQGRHPDVDPHFWDDWKEPPHVDLASLEPTLRQDQKEVLAIGSILGGCCMLTVGLPIFLIVRARRKAAKRILADDQASDPEKP